MYFENFPKIRYKFENSTVILTDITLRTKLISTIEDKIFAFEQYTIRDGDRPDTVSYRYYGRSDLDWLVLITNKMIGLEDWPNTDRQIVDGLIKIYGSLEAVDNTLDEDSIAYYLDSNGFVVSFDYIGTKTPITILQDALLKNDLKRQIKLIKPEYVGQILREQKELLAQ